MPEEIIKGIYRIRVNLPNSPLKLLNSYIIIGEGENLLIDTGFNRPECLESLTEGLKALGVKMEETDILLTHLHADHSGLVPKLIKNGRRVFIGRDELPWMYGETRSILWELDNIKVSREGFSEEVIEKHLIKAPSRNMASEPDFDGFTPLDDGDILSYGGYELRAVLTPGHTPAHMCFWIEDEKLMFTGDHVLFDITPNITLWNFVEDSLGDYLHSLREIDKYDVRIALPGHRETGDFHGRIAELLKHHEERLDECYKVLCENPDSTIYEVSGKMSWKIRCNSWEDFPITQKWFAVGECHSHLRHLETRGLAVRDDSEDTILYRAVQ
ncbi:MAG: MBL fold metallo-hydrolase [Clostridiales bacterium]|jgi:glyoxylase-like metal-dependent hydrolase (beta-lactamase superfamily II)|nr:MBL fold metallo-hydrolase [Clostridiales bacterium]